MRIQRLILRVQHNDGAEFVLETDREANFGRSLDTIPVSYADAVRLMGTLPFGIQRRLNNDWKDVPLNPQTE